MRRFAPGLAAAALLGVASTGVAVDRAGARDVGPKHSIRLSWHSPVEGAVVSIALEQSQKVAVVLRSDDVILQREDRDQSYLLDMTQRIVRVEDGRVRAEQRTFDSASGRDGGAFGELTLAGRTFDVTRGADGVVESITEAGQPVSAPERSALLVAIGTHDVSNELEPDGPVGVGETWELDAERLAEAFFGQSAPGESGPVDLSAAMAEARLVAVERRGGARHGTIDFELLLPLRTLSGFELDRPLPCRFRMRYTGCIDGTQPDCTIVASTVVQGSRTAVAPGGEVLELDVDVKSEVNGRSETVPTGPDSSSAH